MSTFWLAAFIVSNKSEVRMQLSSRLSQKHWPQPVADDGINVERGPAFAFTAKKQFSTSITVNIDGIYKFKFRDHVEVLIVCGLGKHFVQLTVDIFPSNQRSRVLQGNARVRDRCRGSQNQLRLVAAGEVEDVHLHLLQFRRCRRVR